MLSATNTKEIYSYQSNSSGENKYVHSCHESEVWQHGGWGFRIINYAAYCCSCTCGIQSTEQLSTSEFWASIKKKIMRIPIVLCFQVLPSVQDIATVVNRQAACADPCQSGQYDWAKKMTSQAAIISADGTRGRTGWCPLPWDTQLDHVGQHQLYMLTGQSCWAWCNKRID